MKRGRIGITKNNWLRENRSYKMCLDGYPVIEKYRDFVNAHLSSNYGWVIDIVVCRKGFVKSKNDSFL